jgi:hypothetical protein
MANIDQVDFVSQRQREMLQGLAREHGIKQISISHAQQGIDNIRINFADSASRNGIDIARAVSFSIHQLQNQRIEIRNITGISRGPVAVSQLDISNNQVTAHAGVLRIRLQGVDLGQINGIVELIKELDRQR